MYQSYPGWAASSRRSAASSPGAMASSLSKNSTQSPLAAFRPVLRAAASPPFLRWITWKPGISAAKASHSCGLASVEPSSTRMHSQSLGPGCSATLLTQSAR